MRSMAVKSFTLMKSALNSLAAFCLISINRRFAWAFVSFDMVYHSKAYDQAEVVTDAAKFNPMGIREVFH